MAINYHKLVCVHHCIHGAEYVQQANARHQHTDQLARRLDHTFALPTRHCQARPRRNGLVIVFRDRKMHQGQTRANFYISVLHDTPIISQKNAHVHSKEAPSMDFTSTNKILTPSGACVVLMRGTGVGTAPAHVTGAHITTSVVFRLT